MLRTMCWAALLAGIGGAVVLAGHGDLTQWFNLMILEGAIAAIAGNGVFLPLGGGLMNPQERNLAYESSQMDRRENRLNAFGTAGLICMAAGFIARYLMR
ncbi:MAG: hypothetical protein IKF51_08230 [Solobacterium sp.]|nr:hypothetical protein [Solobacterium sp.]